MFSLELLHQQEQPPVCDVTNRKDRESAALIQQADVCKLNYPSINSSFHFYFVNTFVFIHGHFKIAWKQAHTMPLKAYKGNFNIQNGEWFYQKCSYYR